MKRGELVNVLSGNLYGNKTSVVIVSRHTATIAALWEVMDEAGIEPRIINGNATAEDVKGKYVFGDLPMHLAAKANQVWAVEFKSFPPHGEELKADDMWSFYGMTVSPYRVTAIRV